MPFTRKDPDRLAELLKVLQLSLSDLRDRRIFWLMRVVPSEICLENMTVTIETRIVVRGRNLNLISLIAEDHAYMLF